MIRKLDYLIKLTYDKTYKGYVADVVNLYGCMSQGKTKNEAFANGEYYHIFNRGVEKRPTFMTKYEFLRAVDSMSFYRFANLPIRYSKYLALSKEKQAEFLKGLDNSDLQVEVIAYCFMRNHF